MKDSPPVFIRKIFLTSTYFAVGLAVLFFFVFSVAGINLIFILPTALLLYLMLFVFMLHSPIAAVRKRDREISKEVLFAGRYLLVKLESGIPLHLLLRTIFPAENRYSNESSSSAYL